MSTTIWSMLASSPGSSGGCGFSGKRFKLARRYDVIDGQRLIVTGDPHHIEVSTHQPARHHTIEASRFSGEFSASNIFAFIYSQLCSRPRHQA